MRVIIMRGLPGAGKSRWVGQNCDPLTTAICSADRFHEVEGEYKYNQKRAQEAHDWCLKYFLNQLTVQKPETIVVDNTNTSAAEIAPYARLAGALGVEFKLVYILCDVSVSITRNIHAVPAATILRMNRNLLLEEIPPWWPQEAVIG